MKTLSEISTHKAIKTATNIEIIEKGLHLGDLHYEDELLYTIPLENEDDVFAIMERYEENNRCNVAEFNSNF